MRHLLLGLFCAAALLAPGSARSHAHLDHATPAAGSTVTQAPRDVVIWFTEALEPKFSAIEVRDMKGVAVHEGTATVDRDNRAQLRVPLKALPPGTYKVIWRVLSVDTHRSQGEFIFRVAP